MNRRQLSTIALLAALAALSGCASLNQISSEVSSYGQWPPGRPAGRYFIERLPSQAAQTTQTAPTAQAAQAGATPAVPPLEAAAHGALQAAGFQRAPSLETADVVVQIGARVTRYDISPWADPLWWRWGPRYWRGPAWTGQRFYSTPPGWRTAPPPDREVALLLRDRATSVPLWEARAVSSGISTELEVFQAMFSAALSDFPNAKPQAHSVSVTLPAKR